MVQDRVRMMKRCASRWKLNVLPRPPPLKPKQLRLKLPRKRSARDRNKRPVAKRRRRLKSVVKRRSVRELLKKKLKGSARRKRKPSKCARCNKSSNAEWNRSASSN